MHFAFDESGRFALTRSPSQHAASVVMGVVVSEVFDSNLRNDFASFVSSLSEQEKRNDEPKGNLLSLRSRSDFCDLMNAYRSQGLMFTPITVDMGYMSTRPDYFTPSGMQKYLEEFSKQCPTEEIAESWRKFGRDFGSLSVPQAWRICAWAVAFLFALENAIRFLCSDGHESYWNEVVYEIDKVELAKDGTEETIFATMIRGWLAGWSQHRKVLHSVHTPDNPFVQSYVSERGINIGQLIGDGIHFVDSKNSWRVQLADIASNIVFRAVNDLENSRGDLYVYASLMRSSPYGNEMGPGLINPTSHDDQPPREVRDKYKPLYDILRNRLPIRW